MRDAMRAQRKALSKETVVRDSDAAIAQLCEASLVHGKHVAIYLSYHQEIMAEQLISWLFQHHMHCYLPVIDAGSKTLSFAQYHPNSALIPNRYGILEPVAPYVLREPSQLNTVIVPLVAFTERCERLGMGAGYYDHTFAFLNKTPRPERPILVGLAYDFQEVPSLEHHAHDVTLDYVVTQTRIIRKES